MGDASKLTLDELDKFSAELDTKLIAAYTSAIRDGLTPELKKQIEDLRAFDPIVNGAANCIWRIEAREQRDVNKIGSGSITKSYDA